MDESTNSRSENVQKGLPTNFQLERPRWVSHFNQFGPASGGADKLLPLDPEDLKRLACEACGLDDFGTYPWEEAYNNLLWSLNHEAGLNTLGRLMVRAEILRTLQVRLRLTAFWKDNPEVLSMPVNAPIIIAGAARTGTSILQEVLSEDERFHLPYTWKCLDPLPLATDAAQDLSSRIERAKCESEFWVDVQPEFRAMHDFGATLPTECLIFLSTDYSADFWAMVAELPGWEAWRQKNDYARTVYRWHKRMLQTMQYNEPDSKVWLLKSPGHLAFLDIVKETYPDVRIIHTHRDPAKCIPSTANVTSTVRWERSDKVDYKAIGSMLSFGFQFALENVISQRLDGRLSESQIIDIHLRDLIKNPVKAIRQIYDHFGLVFSETMEHKILQYLANKPKGKFGKHEYDMSKFGLDAISLRKQFKRYIDYYKIAIED